MNPGVQFDRVYGSLNATETTEQSIGTITVPAGATVLVAVDPCIMQPTATAGEQISGYLRPTASTLPPKTKIPARTIAGPAGTLATGSTTTEPKWVQVNWPVTQLDTITVYGACDVALTGTASAFLNAMFK